LVCFVFDRAALVEFEEYCGVYLAEFALGRSEPTLNYQSWGLGGKNSWTITKQLTVGVKLPVNLKADSKSKS
jgi:hypothetical protein